MFGRSRIVTMVSAAVLIGLSLGLSAQAQTVTLGQFQHPTAAKDLDTNKTYLRGATDGLVAYNRSLEDKLFCVPGRIPVVTFEQASNIVMRWARKTSGSSDISLGSALLFALRDAYPCPR